jgi:hypothetical protein
MVRAAAANALSRERKAHGHDAKCEATPAGTKMSTDTSANDYLVLSRGQWDADKSRQEIQAAIDQFYAWYDQLVADGRVKPGHRLAREGKMVSKQRVSDGPFAETKELIGGYWIIVAGSLEEAAQLAARNPTIACGLSFEVRPIELKRASAYDLSNESPRVTAAAGKTLR